MKVAAATLCLLIAASFSALAADWGKVTWGMSRAEVTAQYPTAVTEGEALVASRAAEIADIFFNATFEFRQDKLIGVSLFSDNTSPAIAQSSPDTFRDLLIGKYGEPLLLKGAGTEVEGIWRTDRTVIKFVSPPAPAPHHHSFSLYYSSLKAPRFDEI